MCLTIGNNKLLQANSDISCYKLVDTKGAKLFTFYRGVPVSIGNTYKSKIVDCGGEVNIGIHSLTNIRDARRLKNLEKNFCSNSIIIKCIIPKGSFYYRGLFGSKNSFKSYASTSIKYIEMM